MGSRGGHADLRAILSPATDLGFYKARDGPSCMLLLLSSRSASCRWVKLDLSDHSCSSQPSFQRGTLTPYTLPSPSSACRVCPWPSASQTSLCSAPAKPAPPNSQSSHSDSPSAPNGREVTARLTQHGLSCRADPQGGEHTVLSCFWGVTQMEQNLHTHHPSPGRAPSHQTALQLAGTRLEFLIDSRALTGLINEEQKRYLK